jgi:hypothetical protein
MPNERVSMSKLKQLIALHASNLSVRAIARALSLSVDVTDRRNGAGDDRLNGASFWWGERTSRRA